MRDGSGAKAIFSILGAAGGILLLAFTLSGEARGIASTEAKLLFDTAKSNIRHEHQSSSDRIWQEFGRVNTKIDRNTETTDTILAMMRRNFK